MTQIIVLLHTIQNRLDSAANTLEEQQNVPLSERRLWSKQEVLDKLNVSDRTYKRHVKNGLLKPMRFNGGDEFFEEDILKAMEESRRRGRV